MEGHKVHSPFVSLSLLLVFPWFPKGNKNVTGVLLFHSLLSLLSNLLSPSTLSATFQNFNCGFFQKNNTLISYKMGLFRPRIL